MSHAERGGESPKTGSLQALPRPRDGGFVRDRGVGQGPGPRGLERVRGGLAPNPEDLLRPAVPGLQLVVGEGPGGREPAQVLHRLEVAPAVAHHHRPEELGVAPHVVVGDRVEPSAVALVPGLVGEPVDVVEDGLRRKRMRAGPHRLAALDDEHFGPGRGDGPRHGGPADPGPDDSLRQGCRRLGALVSPSMAALGGRPPGIDCAGGFPLPRE